MKFLIDNWTLILIAVSSAGLLLWPVIKGAGPGLSPSAAVLQINRDKAVVVDVGDAAQFAAEHIGSSKHVSLAEIKAKLPEVVKNKETPIIFVCPKGMRSKTAASLAKDMGYTRAEVLFGGLVAWKEAGLPTDKA